MSSTDDHDLWTAYTQRVKRPKKPTAKRKPDTIPKKSEPATATPSPTKIQTERLRIGASVNMPFIATTNPSPITIISFDRKNERRLRDGSFPIDARLDLHGMTQTQAHGALARFITTQHKAGHRKLLVITGKGRGREGVLRQQLQGWLESLAEAPHILTIRHAATRHGGDGAFYVLLKKSRTD